jgi:hypothetical protein
MPATVSSKKRTSKKIGVKSARAAKRTTVRAKQMPLPGQPGFDLDKAIAETKRIAATLPLGSIFRSPATGGLVMHSSPITSEEVYEHYY